MRIAIFSFIPWDFLKQRTHAMAVELTRMGHDIYYFEPFMFSRRPDRFLSEAIKSVRIRESGEHKIHVLSSPYFWSKKRYSRYFSLNKVLSGRIVRLIRRHNIDFIIVLDPEYALPVISSGVPHAYDHLDDTQYMEGVPTERYIENMNRLKETGAFTIYIQKLEAEKDPKGLFVPNGCYPDEFFPIECTKKFDAVFLGNILSWCDLDSILASEKEILIIGPMDWDKGNNLQKYLKAGRENIYYIPEIPKNIANLWLNAARVGLVAFKEDHPVVQYAMPVKILEYFLCNLPVVTYRNAGIEHQYGDLVTYYSSTGNGPSLDKAIEAALRREDGHEYRKFAEQYAWPSIVKQLEGKILEAIQRK